MFKVVELDVWGIGKTLMTLLLPKKRVVLGSLKFFFWLIISYYLLSCKEKSNIYTKNSNVLSLNDSTSAVVLDQAAEDCSLVKIIRKDNTISKILFTDKNFNFRRSELFTFNESENLKEYYLFENDSSYKFKLIFDSNRKLVDFEGKLGIYLDSICTNHLNEKFLYFSYPRIPYYDIKPSMVLMYDTINDFDSIIPVLRGNCYLIHKIRNEIPLYIQVDMHYKHKFNNSIIDLAEAFKTDTIKKILLSDKKPLYYIKEFDYNEYPFVKN